MSICVAGFLFLGYPTMKNLILTSLKIHTLTSSNTSNKNKINGNNRFQLKYTIWCPGCGVTGSMDKLPPLHMIILIFHEDYKLWSVSHNFLQILAIFPTARYFYFYSLSPPSSPPPLLSPLPPPPHPPPPPPLPTYSSMARQFHLVVTLEYFLSRYSSSLLLPPAATRRL